MAKIISISNQENQLIAKAKKQDRLAQKHLFDMYSPKMLSVCRYYIHDIHFAEDVMIKGFFKAFTKLNSYRKESSFYTWLKRIITYECIDFLRSKTHKLQYAEWDDSLDFVTHDLEGNYTNQALQSLIDELPEGCRVIFNLYVMEDFKHKEIADKLQISIGTSKSQLSYARKFLQEKLKEKNYV